MREIKSREWNDQMKKMYDVINLTCSDSRNALVAISGDAQTAHKLHGDFPLMQYTGLKDKNGKEIYEGDVLEAVYTKDDGHQYFIRGEVTHSVFGFTLHATSGNDKNLVDIRGNLFDRATMLAGGAWEPFFLKGDPYNDKHLTSYHSDDRVLFEVIGNIYENPGLLNNN